MRRMDTNEKTGSDAGSRKKKKMVLGRGLDALIAGIEPDEAAKDYFHCAIAQIRPNRFQPRIQFSEQQLRDLADSIREQGIIQPLLVRTDRDGYELVTGERRLRAAKLAGLSQVPVVVRNLSDADLLEMSIVENIQREDLNPMEEAEAYHRLMTEFHLTQEQTAIRVSKSRPAVANMLRLRQLSQPIKESILQGQLSMGHARALLGAETAALQNAAWRVVLAKKLSVRETENLIRRMKAESEKPVPKPSSEAIHFTHLAEDLSRHLGTRVQIKRRGRKGKVEIEYYSDEDLDRLIQYLKREAP
jgi:ParB family chromosome partitioning protein